MYNIFDDNIQLVIKDYQHNKDINPDETSNILTEQKKNSIIILQQIKKET